MQPATKSQPVVSQALLILSRIKKRRNFGLKSANRHLRAVLDMPALVAIQHESNVKAFYHKLIAAGKKPMQAVVAVMRKLLHAI